MYASKIKLYRRAAAAFDPYSGSRFLKLSQVLVFSLALRDGGRPLHSVFVSFPPEGHVAPAWKCVRPGRAVRHSRAVCLQAAPCQECFWWALGKRVPGRVFAVSARNRSHCCTFNELELLHDETIPGPACGEQGSWTGCRQVLVLSSGVEMLWSPPECAHPTSRF